MRTALLVYALLAAVGLTLSACGGSTSTPAGQARARDDSELALIGSNGLVRSAHAFARSAAAPRTHDPVTSGHRPARARIVENGPNDEFNATGAEPLNPCGLVRKSEAHAIVGRPILKVWRAPQGPTCIYQVRGAKNYITLAVETAGMSALRKHARPLSHRRVRGRTAYCIRQGSVATLVPLSRNRVLQITSSCSVGARFAAKALTRLR